MNNKIIQATILGVFFTFGLTNKGFCEKAGIIREASPDIIETLFNKSNLDYKELGNNQYSCEIGGYKVIVILEKGTMQLAAVFSGKFSLNRINQWNKQKRFTRAYISDENDAVLEAELDFTGGVTAETLVGFFKTYKISVETFAKHIE